MEDYEKKYKEVLKKIREGLQPSPDGTKISGVTRAFLEEVFPELKESEDELTWLTEYIEEEAYSLSMDIRDNEDCIKLKNLKKSLAWLNRQVPTKISEEDEKIKRFLIQMAQNGHGGNKEWWDKCVAWLEKQGKSSDQIHYWTEEEIEPIISDYLRGAEHYGGMIGRLRCLKPKSLEKQVEQKPISDTKYEGKAGDSLSVNGKPFDYEKATITQKDFALPSQSERKSLQQVLNDMKNDVDYFVRYAEAFVKEQEHKSAWSDEDESYINNAIAACRSLYGEYSETAHWLKSLKDRVQPKQEWSEEDKEMFDRIDESLYYYATKLRCEKDYSLADAVKEEQSWLFSLKNRIQPQPQQEWSEEDEEMTEDLIKGCLSSEKTHHLVHTSKEIVDWLDSVKNRMQK